jgi:TPR repeat protein
MDRPRAVKLFDRACGMGDQVACGNLGWMYVAGVGVERDAERGTGLLAGACDRQDGRSCYRLGMVESARDPAGAVARFRRACELGDADGCASLAVAYIDGDAIEPDRETAVHLAQYACQEGSAAACTLAGQIFTIGFGVQADEKLAGTYFEYACRLGDVHGCEILATWREGEHARETWQQGLGLRDRACQDGSVDDCIVMAAYYLRGLGVDKDSGRAVELFRIGCDAGSPDACRSLGQILLTGTGVDADPVAAFAALERACRAGDIAACTWQGLGYQRGHGVPVDLARAFELYRRGCEAGVGFGCVGLSKLYAEGRGVRRSKRQAARYRRQACELGETAYCD